MIIVELIKEILLIIGILFFIGMAFLGVIYVIATPFWVFFEIKNWLNKK